MRRGLASQQTDITRCRQHTPLDTFTRKIAKRIQTGTGLPHALYLAPLAPGSKAHGLRFIVHHQAAQRILRAKFKKIADSLTVPHGLYALAPAHRIFIQVSDVLAGGRRVARIELRIYAAQHGPCGRAHIKSTQAAQRNIAQHAHAGMVKSQAHIEHNGRNTAFAQAFTSLLQHLAGAAQNKLVGSVVVGNVKCGPRGTGFVNNTHICVYGHHARFAGGPGLQLAHVYGAGVDDIPCHLGLYDARHTQSDHFAKTVTAKKPGAQPQR